MTAFGTQVGRTQLQPGLNLTSSRPGMDGEDETFHGGGDENLCDEYWWLVIQEAEAAPAAIETHGQRQQQEAVQAHRDSILVTHGGGVAALQPLDTDLNQLLRQEYIKQQQDLMIPTVSGFGLTCPANARVAGGGMADSSMSTFRILRRHNSWPLTTSLERIFLDECRRYVYKADPNLPSFLRRDEEQNSVSSTDSDMPSAICGRCQRTDCNGMHLSYCITWRNLSVELNLDLPKERRIEYRSRHVNM